MKPVVERSSAGALMFDCPGCGFYHQVWVGEGDGPRWAWNGDTVKPTFAPSIKVTWPEGPQRIEKCCHSFVRDGQIEFLGDCTHALAGQTVPLPPMED